VAVSKILFLNCYDDMMLALRTMSAQLQADGHEVYLLALRHLEDCFTPCDPPLLHPVYNQSMQTTQKEVDLVVSVFEKIDPDWVGFSVTSNHIGLFIYLGKLFKQIKPGLTIVWGGADVWFNAEEDIQYADIIVLSEADAIINDLAKAIDGDKDLAEVPGIWYHDKNGDVCKNRKLEPFEDLESLPPGDWSLDRFYEVSDNQLYPHGYHPYSIVGQGFRNVMTARGCPFTCSFCCNGFEREDVNLTRLGRQRSVDHVIAELKHIKKVSPGTGMIYFSDEVFPMNRRWVEEFADVYHREIGLPFACYAYPTTVKPWFAQALATMGEGYVLMGIQSGSDRLNREVFHRFATQEDAIQAGRIFADHGILYSIDLIGHNPFETEEDFRESLNLLIRMPRPFLFQAVYQLMFWKNFPITDKAFAQGIPLIQTNEHTWLCQPKPEYAFWQAVLVIAGACKSISPDLAYSFADNPLYRQRPELLNELMQQVQLMNFTRTVTGNWQYKDKHIRDLENYYCRMEGSRAVKTYFTARDRVKKVVEDTKRLSRNLLHLPSMLGGNGKSSADSDEIREIFSEHQADMQARKASFANGKPSDAKKANGVKKPDGANGTQGTNGSSSDRKETRKRFMYPKASQVRAGRAKGDAGQPDEE